MSTEQTTTEAPPPKFDLSVLPPAMQTVRAQYDLAVRQAKAYAESSLVPAQYKENIPNAIIAVNMANRIGMDVLMVMQNLYIVHGNPGWSGKFLIAAFNQCGRYSSMRFETRGDPIDSKDTAAGMRAYATEKATGEIIRGPWVTWGMVKGEKWDAKDGSKWKTMPELMFMYRAAAFLTRTHAPEIAMGLQTVEELHDTSMIDVTPVGEMRERPAPTAIDRAKAAVGQVLEAEKATPADDAPNEILAHVLEALDAATTRDKLDDVAIRIDGIRDLEEREAARTRYHDRLAKLEPEGNA